MGRKTYRNPLRVRQSQEKRGNDLRVFCFPFFKKKIEKVNAQNIKLPSPSLQSFLHNQIRVFLPSLADLNKQFDNYLT